VLAAALAPWSGRFSAQAVLPPQPIVWFAERRGVDAAGGGAAAAESYGATYTAGQPVVGRAASAAYTLGHGYWPALDTGPVLGPLSDQTVNEGVLLAFTVAILEGDGPLTFSLEPGAPVGASIDAATGRFTWTPSEAQGPGTYLITVKVADAGPPSFSHTRAFTVTVLEVNAAPVPGALTIFAKAGVPKKFTLASILAVASDAEGDRLTVASVANASAQGGAVRVDGAWVIYQPPPGVTFPDTIGYWITDGQVAVPGLIRIEEVAPGAEPTQNLVRLRVLPNGDIQLDFVGVPHYTYRIQVCGDLTVPDWHDLGVATADRYGRFQFIDLGGAFYPVRYYRTVHP